MSSACRKSRRDTTTSRARCEAPRSSHAAFVPAERKGYSGVAIYAKRPPRTVEGFGCREFDAEGRYLEAHFAALTVISVYLPSGSSGPHRQASKFRFLEAFLPHLTKLRKQKREIVICGDWNIAHREIDLKNWRSNQKNSGFLPEERAVAYARVRRARLRRRLPPPRLAPRPVHLVVESRAGLGEQCRLADRLPDRDARNRGEGEGGGDLHEPALFRPCAAPDRLRLRTRMKAPTLSMCVFATSRFRGTAFAHW